MGEAEPLEMRYQALPGNEGKEGTRERGKGGGKSRKSEAEPLDMRSQALPGNEEFCFSSRRRTLFV